MTSLFQAADAVARPGVTVPTQSTNLVRLVAAARSALGTISLTVHDDLAAIEHDWRQFEEIADCTVFQSFAWQSLWRKHIGEPAGSRPAIVVGRERERILFIFPLAIERGRIARTLTWHAGDLCDYNAPLLAPAFAAAVDRPRFLALYAEIRRTLARDRRFAYDAVCFDKMPETVGGQANPFMALATSLNPSGAYATQLSGDWDTFYVAKRSSATRRRDRTKRKRFADIGEVNFVTAETRADIAATYDILVEQKTAQLRAIGAEDLFARPGFRALFLDMATDPANGARVHISHLDVGGSPAAVNLGLIFRERYYHIFASYDATGPAARFGPGAAHLHDLMRYAIGAGCTVFDFTIGDEPYKREWADIVMALHDHRSALTLVGVAAMAPAMAIARAKRFIKRSPKLWALAQKVRAARAGMRPKAEEPAPE